MPPTNRRRSAKIYHFHQWGFVGKKLMYTRDGMSWFLEYLPRAHGFQMTTSRIGMHHEFWHEKFDLLERTCRKEQIPLPSDTQIRLLKKVSTVIQMRPRTPEA